MVSLILTINIYELRLRLRKEIGKRIRNIDVDKAPLDLAWLLYALSLDGRGNNPVLEQYIGLLENWTLSEKSSSMDKYLAPLSICGILSSKPKVSQIVVKKIKEIIKRSYPKKHIRFNVLNDPEQIFCLSLLLKNEEEIRGKIINVIKRNINGRVSRKVLFIASLIEFNENPKEFLKMLEISKNIEDIISILWLYERYRNIIKGNLSNLWSIFDEVYPILKIEKDIEKVFIPNRCLALLYEALTREITKPDPVLLFDLYPFHPRIRMIAEGHFKNKKYTSAVFEAAKKLNEFIQEVTGIRNKNEAELVQATMKQISNPKKLKIIFNEYLHEASGKNEQKGLALITEGIFTAFRNPKGHKSEDHPLVNITPYEALGQLITIDFIMKRIENAKVNKE